MCTGFVRALRIWLAAVSSRVIVIAVHHVVGVFLVLRVKLLAGVLLLYIIDIVVVIVFVLLIRSILLIMILEAKRVRAISSLRRVQMPQQPWQHHISIELSLFANRH
jgi:hypothetical protein